MSTSTRRVLRRGWSMKPKPPVILLAEDDEDLRDSLVGLLESAGYSVIGVSDGVSLLDEVESVLTGNGSVALIMTDERLPGLRGSQALRQARAWGYTLPQILMTGYGGEEVALRASEVGAAFLTKPLCTEDLLAMVRCAVRDRDAAALSCATCGSQENLRALDQESAVFFCESCLDLDPFIERGGSG